MLRTVLQNKDLGVSPSLPPHREGLRRRHFPSRTTARNPTPQAKFNPDEAIAYAAVRSLRRQRRSGSRSAASRTGQPVPTCRQARTQRGPPWDAVLPAVTEFTPTHRRGLIGLLALSRFHLFVITALGVTWILDGREVTSVGAIGPVLETRTHLEALRTAGRKCSNEYVIFAALARRSLRPPPRLLYSPGHSNTR